MIRRAALAIVAVCLLVWVGWQLLPGPVFAPVVLDAPASAPDEVRPDSREAEAGRAPQTRARPPTADAPAADAGPRDRTGTRRDLQTDETRGGHTIARHVGRTDAQLRERLARESIAAASTYPDLETAERVVGLTLRRHTARVEQWQARQGARPNLVLQFAAPRQPAIGRVLRRDAPEPVDAHAAVVVLRWRGDDFFVLTSYPEDRVRGR